MYQEQMRAKRVIQGDSDYFEHGKDQKIFENQEKDKNQIENQLK